MPKPAFWARLDLPAPETDHAEELAALLHRLRVPSAVRHSCLEGGTFAYLPTDDDGALLALDDTYGPSLEWSLLDRERLIDGVNSLAGPGCTLDGEPLEQPQEAPDDEFDRDGSEPGSVGCIDAIVWTTHEKPDMLAALAARFDMSFDAVDAGHMGRALTVHDPADRDRALTTGVWAMFDGVALWRSGEEAAAAVIHRRAAALVQWRHPWLRADPSKPGQEDEDGSTVSAILAHLIREEPDVGPWAERFQLDQEQSTRLRALFRREPHPTVLDELCEILKIPSAVLAVLSNAESNVERTVIAPRTAREQFKDEMRSALAAAAPPPKSFRGRHPRIWIGLSVALILALTAMAVLGWSAGRPTAVIPGLVALVWIASLVITEVARRVHRDDSNRLTRPQDGASSKPVAGDEELSQPAAGSDGLRSDGQPASGSQNSFGGASRHKQLDAGRGEQRRHFDSLVVFTRGLVGPAAEVEVVHLENIKPASYCDVTPRNLNACRISITAEQMLSVTFGEGGCEWMMSYTEENLAYARRLIEAVVSGRVQERTAFGRARIYITLDTGERDSSTSYNGCLTLIVPQPAWKTRGRLRSYEHY